MNVIWNKMSVVRCSCKGEGKMEKVTRAWLTMSLSFYHLGSSCSFQLMS